jgi:hypothetical protein
VEISSCDIEPESPDGAISSFPYRHDRDRRILGGIFEVFRVDMSLRAYIIIIVIITSISAGRPRTDSTSRGRLAGAGT